MNQISADFERFIQNILLNQQVYVKVAFSTIDDLKICAKYFFDQAVINHSLSKKFAEAAARLYFITPTTSGKSEEPFNLRKALIVESQYKVEELQSNLERKTDLSLEKALGIIKFFGELYNVGFIFKGILKKHLDMLGARRHECIKSNHCYYLLVETVKEKVRLVHESDYSMTIKSMIEAFEEAEINPTALTTSKTENKTSQETPKKFDQAFPKLDVASSQQAQMSMKADVESKRAAFQNLLTKLKSEENSDEIIKQIEDKHSYVFEDEMWQICYEELVEKAMNNPELALAILHICVKLPNCKTDVWRGITSDGSLKIVNKMLCQQIVKMFNETNPTRTRFIGFIKFTQKLLELSLCSIENIGEYVNVVIDMGDKNIALSSDFLTLLFTIVKKKFSRKIARKLPEEVRRKVVQIVKKDEKKDVKELEDYLFKSNKAEVSSSPHAIQNENLSSSTRSSPLSMKSSASSENIPKIFDYKSFCDDLISNDVDFVKQSIRSTNSDFDLTKFAEVLYEKSIKDGCEGRHFRLAIIVDEICSSKKNSFRDILVVTAFKGFANGLRNELDSNKITCSAAMFLSELFKLEWLSKFYFLQCMDQLSRDNFETLRLAEAMTALLEPSVSKIKADIKDDRFMFYLQLIRAKSCSAGNSKSISVYSKLTNVLEKITGTSYDGSFVQEIARNIPSTSPTTPTVGNNERFEEIVSLVKNADLNDLELAVRKIDWISIKDDNEVSCLVDALISQAMLVSNRAERFAFLTFMLSKSAHVSFKTKLTDLCQLKFFGYFTGAITKSQETLVYGLIQYIASLHKLDMINQDFIKHCLDIFMEKEKNCECTVNCIAIFIQTIGSKLEKSNPDTIAKFFKFFNHVVANEKTYRSKVYENMIQLRGNKWISRQSNIQPKALFETKQNTPTIHQAYAQPIVQQMIGQAPDYLQSQWSGAPLLSITTPGKTTILQNELPINQAQRVLSPVPKMLQSAEKSPTVQIQSIVIDFENIKYEDEIDEIAFNLKQSLTSVSHVIDFIKALITLPFRNHKEILTCAELLERLVNTTIKTKMDNEIKFITSLLNVLNQEFVKTNGLSTLNTEEAISFANVIVLVAEFYRLEIFSDDDLSTWLLNKHIRNIPVQHLAHLSSIISPKIESGDNKHLKMILGHVESSIQGGVKEVTRRIQEEILKLDDAVVHLSSFKENNSQTNGI